MAGMLARDKPLSRALFFSKGADSVATVELDPGSAEPCSANSDCSSGRCCPLADPGCNQPPASGGICLIPVPAPWAAEGRDLDGDGLGDGGPETRAVPGSRTFAIVHLEEDAWLASPAVFELWQMGAQDRFQEVGPELGPDSPGRLFATALPPEGNCSTHQSMAVDACQPLLANGRQAMWQAWRLMMSSDWIYGGDFEVGSALPQP